jgi:hypothetical protein
LGLENAGRRFHASITVTAHIHADLYGDELDDVASALDAPLSTPAETFRKQS